VIIALLAAMALPAFQKVRRNSRSSAMKNDARQLASAAQQYFMENNTTTVTITYTSGSGLITGNLQAYVKQIGTGYTACPTAITADSTFTMSHPLCDSLSFNSEGQLYTP
jgi:type IV pilus assembly protein PilA